MLLIFYEPKKMFSLIFCTVKCQLSLKAAGIFKLFSSGVRRYVEISCPISHSITINLASKGYALHFSFSDFGALPAGPLFFQASEGLFHISCYARLEKD